jgi:DNA-binding HxlR family transcriptional regulator
MICARRNGPLLWTDAEFRGCGMVVDWLRDRWFYACLAMLYVQPMSPSELLALFQATYRANAPIFGPHLVYSEYVTKHLGTLARGGLVERGPACGRRREYSVTPLGAELLASLSDAAVYARARYEPLARYSRARKHLDPNVVLLPVDPDDEVMQERLRRRSLALLFSVVLAPKWTYATLAALTWGQLRFSQIIAVVNRAAAASPDVVSGRLVDSMLSARLGALQQLGLVARLPAPSGARAVYALTDEGRALMVALEPVARFGMRRNAEMTAAVKAMQA